MDPVIAPRDAQLRRTPTIRARLTLIVVACVVPVAAVAALLIYFDYQRERAGLNQIALNRTRAMVISLEREFASKEAALSVLSTSELLAINDLAHFHPRAILARDIVHAENIDMLDVTGQMRLTTSRAFGADLPKMDKPTVLLQILQTAQPVVSDLFHGPVANKPIVTVGVPVWQNGAIAYALNATIAPEQLERILGEQHLPATWLGVLLDSSGSIVARTHNIGKFLGKKASPDLLKQIASGNEASYEGRTLEGIAVLAAFSRSERFGWTVALGIPLEELTAGLRASLTRLLAVSAAILALGLLLSWWVGGRIARSIHALLEPAKALALGEPVHIADLHFTEANAFGQSLLLASGALQQAQYQAQHDALTGLSNRALFNYFIDQQLALCLRTHTQLAVLYIDLDGFKSVNDTHGHAQGDQLLCLVAQRLTDACRDSDLAARLGGDEFAIGLIHSDLGNACSFAQQLIATLSAPYPLGDVVVTNISASIGVAGFPDSASQGDALLRAADAAMYRAKLLGKRRFVLAD